MFIIKQWAFSTRVSLQARGEYAPLTHSAVRCSQGVAILRSTEYRQPMHGLRLVCFGVFYFEETLSGKQSIL